MEVRQMHRNILETHARKMKRSEEGMTFGPGKRSEFDDLKDTLNALGIGYFGSYAEKVTGDSEVNKVFIHVLHHQARKLSEILRQMELKSEIEFLKSVGTKEEEQAPVLESPKPSPQIQPSKKENRWKSLVKSK